MGWIKEELSRDGKCELTRADLEILWPFAQFHPDVKLIGIHRLAGECGARAAVQRDLRSAIFTLDGLMPEKHAMHVQHAGRKASRQRAVCR